MHLFIYFSFFLFFFCRNSPPKGECVVEQGRSQFFQLPPLSPIHESDFELPNPPTTTTTTNHHHPPLLASIGPQSRLLSTKSLSTTTNTNSCDNQDNTTTYIQVQDIEVIIDPPPPERNFIPKKINVLLNTFVLGAQFFTCLINNVPFMFGWKSAYIQ